MQNPGADIAAVTVHREDGKLAVEMVMQGNAANSFGYHLSLHATDGIEADRIIAQYDVENTRKTGRILIDGALMSLPAKAIGVDRSGKVVRFTVPWPLRQPLPTDMMLRAWTTRGERTLDATAATDFQIVGGAQ